MEGEICESEEVRQSIRGEIMIKAHHIYICISVTMKPFCTTSIQQKKEKKRKTTKEWPIS